MVHLKSGSGPTWFSLLPFFSVSSILRLVVLVCLLIRLTIDEEFPNGLASLLLSFWTEGGQP